METYNLGLGYKIDQPNPEAALKPFLENGIKCYKHTMTDQFLSADYDHLKIQQPTMCGCVQRINEGAAAAASTSLL